jgi:formate hydrogenlyase subunit 3/multisubunit Na+/H+ antiporter MnhD subunit
MRMRLTPSIAPQKIARSVLKMGLTPLSYLLPSILATLRVRKSAIFSGVCTRVSSNFFP